MKIHIKILEKLPDYLKSVKKCKRCLYIYVSFLSKCLQNFFKHFFVWFFPGQTIRVPWKEDSARGSVQKFEVNPVNDLVAFQGKYGQIHLMSSRSRSKLFTLKMNDEVIFTESSIPKKIREINH